MGRHTPPVCEHLSASLTVPAPVCAQAAASDATAMSTTMIRLMVFHLP